MSFRERSSGWKRFGSERAPWSQDRWTILTDSMNSEHSRSKSRMETNYVRDRLSGVGVPIAASRQGLRSSRKVSREGNAVRVTFSTWWRKEIFCSSLTPAILASDWSLNPDACFLESFI